MRRAQEIPVEIVGEPAGSDLETGTAESACTGLELCTAGTESGHDNGQGRKFRRRLGSRPHERDQAVQEHGHILVLTPACRADHYDGIGAVTPIRLDAERLPYAAQDVIPLGGDDASRLPQWPITQDEASATARAW